MSYKQKTQDLLSAYDKSNYIGILQEKLQNSQKLIRVDPSEPLSQAQINLLQRIHTLIKFKEDKVYTSFDEKLVTHFQTIWGYYIKLDPKQKQEVQLHQNKRLDKVIRDLSSQKLMIEGRMTLQPYNYDQDVKNGKMTYLRQQSDKIKNNIRDLNNSLDKMDSDKSLSGTKDPFARLYTSEKKKQAQEFVKRNQKQMIERNKRLEEKRKREQQQFEKKEKEMQENQIRQLKQRKQERLKRQQQLHKEREKEKMMRERRNSEYIKMRKQLKGKAPLFKKWGKQFQQKTQFIESEKRQKVKEEKKDFLKPLRKQDLEKHQKQYEKIREQKETQREEKIHFYMKQQAKSRVQQQTSIQILKSNYDEEKEKEKQIAKEKLEKIRDFKQIVKERYKPKIDEEKKKQLQMKIEQMDLSKKKVKKTVLQNGDIVFQQLNQSDPKQLGLKYLQLTKEIAAKSRVNRKKETKRQQPLGQHRKTVDYLLQMRKNPRKRPDKLQFINKSNLSYDDKVDIVLTEAEKLKQILRNNELRLRFGKFQTSEQILICKEEIDQNYIDLAKMKLKMMKQN